MNKTKEFKTYEVTLTYNRLRAGKHKKVLKVIRSFFEPENSYEAPIVELYPMSVTKYRRERLLRLAVFVNRMREREGRYLLAHAITRANAYPISSFVELDEVGEAGGS